MGPAVVNNCSSYRPAYRSRSLIIECISPYEIFSKGNVRCISKMSAEYSGLLSTYVHDLCVTYETFSFLLTGPPFMLTGFSDTIVDEHAIFPLCTQNDHFPMTRACYMGDTIASELDTPTSNLIVPRSAQDMDIGIADEIRDNSSAHTAKASDMGAPTPRIFVHMLSRYVGKLVACFSLGKRFYFQYLTSFSRGPQYRAAARFRSPDEVFDSNVTPVG